MWLKPHPLILSKYKDELTVPSGVLEQDFMMSFMANSTVNQVTASLSVVHTV